MIEQLLQQGCWWYNRTANHRATLSVYTLWIHQCPSSKCEDWTCILYGTRRIVVPPGTGVNGRRYGRWSPDLYGVISVLEMSKPSSEYPEQHPFELKAYEGWSDVDGWYLSRPASSNCRDRNRWWRNDTSFKEIKAVCHLARHDMHMNNDRQPRCHTSGRCVLCLRRVITGWVCSSQGWD